MAEYTYKGTFTLKLNATDVPTGNNWMDGLKANIDKYIEDNGVSGDNMEQINWYEEGVYQATINS
tara:strand:- start:171 stop:365 length:195 start_codon:yes stop_codon:yes gene_type:complete